MDWTDNSLWLTCVLFGDLSAGALVAGDPLRFSIFAVAWIILRDLYKSKTC